MRQQILDRRQATRREKISRKVERFLKQQEAEVVEQQRRKEDLQYQLNAKVDDLTSKRGVDYTRLRDLLKAGQCKEADQETADRMCEVMDRQKEGWLRVEDIQNFPCVDLRTIDQLWVTHSEGKFGFSVQTKIYGECGAKLNGKHPGEKIWNKFGDRIGWRVKGSWMYHNDLQFDPSISLPGELPVVWVWLGLLWVLVLFSRAETCEL